MRIDKVRIRNFRSIKEMEIAFQPKCLFLVGPNESGKSNILSALSKIDEESVVLPSDLREFHAGEDPDQPAFIEFSLSLTDGDREKVIDSLRGSIQ